MDIDSLTIGDAKKIASFFNLGGDAIAQDEHWEVGRNYFIRTVTHIDIGKLVAVTDKELVLIDASWIADAGRYAQAIADGVLEEVEPYPDGKKVILGRGALIDAVIWEHDLPREQK